MSKEETQEAEVIGISEKKKKAERTADYFRTFARHMNGQHTNLKDGKAEPFYNRYLIELTDDKNRKILMDKGNKTVARVDFDAVKSDIVNYCSDELRHHEYFGNITETQAEKILKFWRLRTKPIKEPLVIGLKSCQDYCFNRLDFDFHQNFEPSDYSSINKLLKNTYNRDAVKYFIGSLFDPSSDLQQVLVLYGEGMNGKSTLLNFLCRCLGDAVTSSVAPNMQNIKNFTARFVGKRLGLFPDAASLDFMQSQEFKMMTGGDLVPIDEKYEKGYSKRLNCKFIISSNHKPSVTGQKSDSRRLIYYEMPEVDKPDPGFIDQLYRQREAIFCHCMDLYFHDIGPNQQIPVETDQLKHVLDENSSQQAAFFDRYFVVSSDGKTSAKTIENCLNDYFGKSAKGRRKFKQDFDLFIRREFKIAKATNHRGNNSDQFWGYKGFELSSGNGTLACSVSSIASEKSDEDWIKWHRKQIEILEEKLSKNTKSELTPNNPNSDFFN